MMEPITILGEVPPVVTLNLASVPAAASLVPTVTSGSTVAAGEIVARGPVVSFHAPITGLVELDGGHVRIRADEHGAWTIAAREELRGGPQEGQLAEYLVAIGLLGMGGSRFPASIKAKASIDVHTLVVNGVGCEPGVTIDTALLYQDTALIRAGAETAAEAVGAKDIVLAVKGSRRHRAALRDIYPYEILPMSRSYPSGAEKLIVRKRTGRMPPTGAFPAQLGILVHNVASLRALGRAVVDGVPVTERPMSIVGADADEALNVVVPIGMAVGDVLASFGVPVNPDMDVVVAGGLMMGEAVGLDYAVDQGTISLAVLTKTRHPDERPCIQCGACSDVCPLQLHPWGMHDRLRSDAAPSAALSIQLDECFLCGACSAVCPSTIPLVNEFWKAKR